MLLLCIWRLAYGRNEAKLGIDYIDIVLTAGLLRLQRPWCSAPKAVRSINIDRYLNYKLRTRVRKTSTIFFIHLLLFHLLHHRLLCKCCDPVQAPCLAKILSLLYHFYVCSSFFICQFWLKVDISIQNPPKINYKGTMETLLTEYDFTNSLVKMTPRNPLRICYALASRVIEQ